MPKEKNFEIQNITELEAMNRVNQERTRILEDFAKAYLAETNLKPSEIELVTEQRNTGHQIEIISYFRKKA